MFAKISAQPHGARHSRAGWLAAALTFLPMSAGAQVKIGTSSYLQRKAAL